MSKHGLAWDDFWTGWAFSEEMSRMDLKWALIQRGTVLDCEAVLVYGLYGRTYDTHGPKRLSFTHNHQQRNCFNLWCHQHPEWLFYLNWTHWVQTQSWWSESTHFTKHRRGFSGKNNSFDLEICVLNSGICALNWTDFTSCHSLIWYLSSLWFTWIL